MHLVVYNKTLTWHPENGSRSDFSVQVSSQKALRAGAAAAEAKASGTLRDGHLIRLSEDVPLKTNMSPENQWLEDVFPTKIVPF